MTPPSSFGLYGAPAPDVASAPPEADQFSPLIPGALALEEAAHLKGMVMAAPPGTLERRYALALALNALEPGAPLTAFAPKTKGGNRIAKELESFGCVVESESRRHQRICRTERPAALSHTEEAIAAGAPRFAEDPGFWTQPGIFSWDRIDPGTALLVSHLPPFTGRGADLGCGLGVITKTVLVNPQVTKIDLIDLDRRAIAAARRNVEDPRAAFHWADVRGFEGSKDLDFVVMNPPFHDGGVEDRALGESFVRRAHQMLRAGGTAWLVANRHLPYESILSSFSQGHLRAEEGGYKVYEAQK